MFASRLFLSLSTLALCSSLLACGGSDEGGASSSAAQDASDVDDTIQGESGTYAFAGSCLYPDYCSDQYDDGTFGVEALESICTSNKGVWSTTHCDQSPYLTKCTQEVFGGLYIHYQGEMGACIMGVEEPLP